MFTNPYLSIDIYNSIKTVKTLSSKYRLIVVEIRLIAIEIRLIAEEILSDNHDSLIKFSPEQMEQNLPSFSLKSQENLSVGVCHKYLQIISDNPDILES